MRRGNLYTESACGPNGGCPARFRIGADKLTADDGDATMAKLEKMLHCQAGSVFVIEDNVGDAAGGGMSGNGNDRNMRAECKVCVDGDKTSNSARHEHRHVVLQLVGAVAMLRNQVGVTVSFQFTGNAAEDLRVVLLPDKG